MKNLSIFLVLILISLSSCQFFGPEKKVVTKGQTNPDGIVVKKVHFDNDPHAPVEWKTTWKLQKDGPALRHGLSTRYSKTGKVYETINYKDNKKEGLRTYYHQNGKVFKEYTYKNNKRDGISKRYDREGKLVAEYSYNGGLPGIGLKEYTNLGKERPAPVLNIKKVDNIRTSGSYSIVCSLTGDGAKRIKSVEYYQGELLDGKWQHKNLKPLKKSTGKKGELKLTVPKGTAINKNLNFVAVAVTQDGLKYILQKKVSVNVRGV